nr:pentatricopeptide repeat-containing protein, chloroplastic [Quercus suber]
MPCKPDADILESLLAACRDCHEIELGNYLSKHLLKSEPDNPGNYVALSNAYTASRRWDEVSYMSDKSHPKIGDVYTTLALLGMEMQFTGYMPTFNGAEILCS